MSRLHIHSVMCVVIAIGFAAPAFAQDGRKPDAPAAAKPADPKHAAAVPVDAKQMSEIQKFCANNVVTAGDAKAAWQAAKLKELDEQIKQRIAELESKRAEYQEWLKKRDETMKKAEEGIVAIYARMKPDAAASQLTAMDDDMAAALLAKLTPQKASLILNEIEPGRAARLTNTMAGNSPATNGKKS